MSYKRKFKKMLNKVTVATLAVSLFSPFADNSNLSVEAAKMLPDGVFDVKHFVGDTGYFVKDGKLLTWGKNDYNKSGRLSGNSTIDVGEVNIPGEVIEAKIEYSSYAITSDGKIYVWGRNDYGQLGLGHTNTVTSPQLLTAFNYNDLEFFDLPSVGGVAHHKDGSIYTWGYGALTGQNKTTNVLAPTKVTLPETIEKVYMDKIDGNSSGSYFLVSTTGSLYTFGSNKSAGVLGSGTTTDVLTPFKVTQFTNVKDVITTGAMSLVLTDSGEVWVSGKDTNWSIGLGATSSVTTFTKLPLSDIVQMEGGDGYSNNFFFTDSVGDVYAFGANRSGSLGVGSTTAVKAPVKLDLSVQVKQFLPLNSLTAFIDTEGNVWTSGDTDTSKNAYTSTSFVKMPDISNVSSINGNEEGRFYAVTNDHKLYHIDYLEAKLMDTQYSISHVVDPNYTYESDFAVTTDNLLLHWGATSKFSGQTVAHYTKPAPINVISPVVPTVTMTPDDVRADLTWTSSPDVDGYRVYSKDGELLYEGTANAFTPKGLTPSTVYSYLVTSFKGSVESQYRTVAGTTKTLAPKNFAIAQRASGAIRLTWENDPQASKYTIKRDDWATPVTLPMGSTSYMDTNGIYDGFDYNYTISMTKSGVESGRAFVSTKPEITINAPANFSVLERTISSIKTKWDAVEGASTYELKRNGSVIYTGGNLEFTDTGLTDGTTYNYSVVAKTSDGTSSTASTTTGTTEVKPVIGQPSDFAASNTTTTSTDLTWGSATNAVEYELKRGNTVVYKGSNLSFSDTSLAMGETYTYTLTAIDANGAKGEPVTEEVTTTTVPPADVEKFTVNNVTPHTVSLSWKQQGDAESYELYRNDDILVYKGELTSFRDVDLNSEQPYKYSVRAVNKFGKSVNFQNVEFTTPPDTGSTEVTEEPIVTPYTVTFDFKVVEGVHTYEINRNPKWTYTNNNDGTFDVQYYNEVTGLTQDLGTVEAVDGTLPFLEEFYNGETGNVKYEITGYKDPAGDGTSVATDPEVVEVNVPAPSADPSTDSTLAALTDSLGLTGPDFDPSKSTYEYELPEGSTSIKFKGNTVDPNAIITVDGIAVAHNGWSQLIDLSTLPKTVTIKVLAEDRVTETEYKVVFKAAVTNDPTNPTGDRYNEGYTDGYNAGRGSGSGGGGGGTSYIEKKMTVNLVYKTEAGKVIEQETKSNVTGSVNYVPKEIKGYKFITTDTKIDVSSDKVTQTITFVYKPTKEKKIKEKFKNDLKNFKGYKDTVGHWAEWNILDLSVKGLISGFSDGTFKPGVEVTRDQFAKIVAYAYDISSNKDYFEDTKDNWSRKNINGLVEAGLIDPKDYGKKFNPSEPITRAEVAKILGKALDLSSTEEFEFNETAKNFKDTDKIAKGDLKYINELFKQKVVSGKDNGNFDPKGKATRAEVSAMLTRFFQVEKR